jgi:hypothetical protein
MPTLQDKVDAALDAAVFENGYTALMYHTSTEVAVDLCTYCAELELEAPDQVALCVADYQQWYDQEGGHSA